MLCKKENIIVGLTTFNNEMLRISIPALSKTKQKFLLIIYNDNPATTVTKQDIKRLGYRGNLIIVNGNENIGTFLARFKIIEEVSKLRFKPDWIVFNDDDDIITDLDIPNISENNFAIIQNSVTIKHRISDLLQVMNNKDNYTIDGENVVLNRPNLGFAGTIFRTNYLINLFKYFKGSFEAIKKVDESLDYRPPVNELIHLLMNLYNSDTGNCLTPIYMDKVNYIKIELDTTPIKYEKLNKPVRNVAGHYQHALSRYEAAIKKELADADAAALRG